MMSSVFDSPNFNQRLFYPRPMVSRAPEGAQDHLVSVDGEVLHVRWYGRPKQRHTLLLFHGNGEVVADYDPFARRFAECGANLVVADYRGYGKSTGIPTLRNILADAHEILRWATNAGASPLIIMGRSLGSACAAELYPQPPDCVVGFVWESGAIDLDALVRRRGLTPPRTFSGPDRRTFDPGPKLARGRSPLLVLHGSQDSLIAPSEAERAVHLAGAQDKALCFIPGRGHNDLMYSPLYWQHLAEFFARLTTVGENFRGSG
jgi:alpha-beta hydrolase superfamily lysophospholipase